MFDRANFLKKYKQTIVLRKDLTRALITQHERVYANATFATHQRYIHIWV